MQQFSRICGVLSVRLTTSPFKEIAAGNSQVVLAGQNKVRRPNDCADLWVETLTVLSFNRNFTGPQNLIS
jgi:hypothetical protein